MVETGWTILTRETTSPSDATSAHIRAMRTTSSALTFHVGCMGIIPGDLDKWFLPSEAPMLLEFTSAPADRARITISGEGTRMARCRMQTRGVHDWQLSSPGDALAQFAALEELE
jgi:hypothetical protein